MTHEQLYTTSRRSTPSAGPAMTRWRQWWENILHRVNQALSSRTEAEPHTRSAEERAHFWAEFRAGQQEADKRSLEDPKRAQPATR